MGGVREGGGGRKVGGVREGGGGRKVGGVREVGGGRKVGGMNGKGHHTEVHCMLSQLGVVQELELEERLTTN